MKAPKNTHVAGMVIGALLLLSPFFGLRFATDHASAFLNVALASDPAAVSSTNTIVLCTTIAGIIGLMVLALSLVSFLRASHVPARAGAR